VASGSGEGRVEEGKCKSAKVKEYKDKSEEADDEGKWKLENRKC
jgi:hypothetical protein